MAINTFEPNETKTITITVDVEVQRVGYHPCYGTEEDLEGEYRFDNGTGHIDYAIEKHLKDILINHAGDVESEAYDLFKIKVSEHNAD